MINTMLIRRAEYRDQQKISNLIFFETRAHRHLDWRSPLDWIGAPFYWVIEEDGHVTAALACPQEPQGIAWIRLFAYSGHWIPKNAWDAIWSIAQDEISRSGGATVALIATQSWFESIVCASGFTLSQQIVLLEWQYQPWAAREANGVRIRTMTEADLPSIAEVDASSFDLLWRNSQATLRNALSQSIIATVAENEHGVVAYQLSTGNSRGAHLARLAVHSTQQGRGVGAALLNDLFQRAWQRGIMRITVNTQNDNSASLNLYQRMGFRRTGEQLPVYTFHIPAKG